jgi:hypothetical protein
MPGWAVRKPDLVVPDLFLQLGIVWKSPGALS